MNYPARAATAAASCAEPSKPIINKKPGWITNDGAEFINSLCPNNQFPFPTFEWCGENERQHLAQACHHAFDMIRAAWHLGVFERLNYNTSEQRLLAVIELKTLRFNKLLEKIPRETFVKGDSREDMRGFEIVPKSGLDDGKVSKATKSLRQKKAIACIKADRRDMRDPSNVYGIAPIEHLLGLLSFYMNEYFEGLIKDHGYDATSCNDLIKGFRKELHQCCHGILEEDRANAALALKGADAGPDVLVMNPCQVAGDSR